MTSQGDLVPDSTLSPPGDWSLPQVTSVRALLGLMVAAVVVCTFGLLSLGIDLTDESYYVVMALRFAQGDQPFVDELFINQTSAILTYPVIKAFLYLQGGIDGIVYFSRVLYFLFAALVTGTIIWGLKGRVRTEYAVVASLSYLAFIPCRIPNLSYNTFGLGFLTMGLFFSLLHFGRGDRLSLVLAGLTLSLSVACYPGMVVGGLAVVLALVMLKRNPGAMVFPLLAGGAIAACLFIPYLVSGAAAIPDVVEYSTRSYGHGGGLEKLFQLAQEFAALVLTPERLVSLLVLGLIIVLKERYPSVVSLGLVVLLLSLVRLSPHPVFGIELHRLAIEVALLSPLFYLLVPKSIRLQYRPIMWLIWFPALCAGLGAGWSTVNGILNAIIGAFPMVIVSLLLLMEWAHYTGVDSGGLPRSFPLYLPAVVCLLFFLAVYFKPYRDDLTSRLNTRISSGAYQGLYTTGARKAALENLVGDIESLQMADGKIVFYEFPAGYLLVPRRSAARNSWMRRVSTGKRFYIDYYEQHLSPHNLVIHVGPSNQDDEWSSYVERTHQLRLARPGYRIYSLRSSG